MTLSLDTPEAFRLILRRRSDKTTIELPLTPMTCEDIADLITTQNDRLFLLNHNLHSIYLTTTNEAFRKFYQKAQIVVIDGQPVRALLTKHDSKFGREYRQGSTDWIFHLFSRDLTGFRVAVVGASADSNAAATLRLCNLCSGATVAGWHGYRDSDQAWMKVFHEIQEFGPNLTIVGLGMPAQENLLVRFEPLLPTGVIATVGGAVDYIAQTKKLAPRWVGSLGAEWLWRLAHEPRRLSRRYIVEPALLVRTWSISLAKPMVSGPQQPRTAVGDAHFGEPTEGPSREHTLELPRAQTPSITLPDSEKSMARRQ